MKARVKALDTPHEMSYNVRRFMKIKKRELITVQLPDGYKIRISNRAKSDGIKLSDIVRLAIRKFIRA